ncbi:two-component system sensor histidine kinase [Sphingobium sp. SYK-6]|uniref:sensor histidine kinase n=1 Tax=Sphingobium sp. (strain NBRC 103272 / SYK-6) TaxID=627192 RepID=UPI0002276B5A|nr:sensor histidine kinase [Sphingobium sp. SYK-6]BAK65477.1 two-component system sensor histidine kinase [Sphingobium sp. SYK-6]
MSMGRGLRLRGSLQFRLIVGSAVGVVLAVLLAGLFIGNLYRIHTTERFQSELDHHLSELIAMTRVDTAGMPRIPQPLSDPQFNARHSGLYWQVDGGEGRIARSVSLGADRLAVHNDSSAWETGRAGDEMLLQRSARVTLDGHEVVATIASAQELLEEQISHFWSDLAWSMSAVGLLLLAGAIALVRFGLAPVRRLGEEVDRLRHGEVARLDPDVPTEFAPLVERLNALLAAQAQLISRARTQSGNLAHNLRTPLALIMDEAEQLRLAGHVETADFLLGRSALMQRQIDYHLTRAAAGGTRGAGTLTEVAPLLDQIITAMKRLHAGRDIAFEVDLPPGLRLPCDRGDLAEILSNLIDNACKWCRHRVIITGAPGGIEIRDDGKGIAAANLQAVLIPGTRLDPETPGTGLGLAATADLLKFSGGELTLGAASEGGLSARVSFAEAR